MTGFMIRITKSYHTTCALYPIVTALDQLKAMAQRKQYRETAQLLEVNDTVMKRCQAVMTWNHFIIPGTNPLR